ncbi:hypothetical protein EDB86DRAFT_2835017 [Lactarius hatsudake]|nr:hypothetical protein EDB86DRAFT_2835017 [Lactarius hatsudake]
MSAIVLHVRHRPPHPPSSSTSTVVLRVTVVVTLHMTATVALYITATVALRDVIVIDPVAIVIGVVAVGNARRVGVALRRLLHAVGGDSGSRLVCGDGSEAAAMGLCAARWRWRWQHGLEQSERILMGRSPASRWGVGAKGQGVVVWWFCGHDRDHTGINYDRDHVDYHDRDHDHDEAADDEGVAEGTVVGMAGGQQEWRRGGIGDGSEGWRRQRQQLYLIPFYLLDTILLLLNE